MSAPSVEVRLIKAGATKISYPAELLADDGTRVSVRAPWAGSTTRDFGFVRFEQGDVFTEYYWRDRWFSVKEVRTGDGALKGWYCDITRPAVLEGGELVVEDLDLDLWVSADGSAVLRLDEDEFEESGLAGRDPEAADRAVQALDELELCAREGKLTALLA
jgi:predicted RNA-binding protein associated with RNAse of E/G family